MLSLPRFDLLEKAGFGFGSFVLVMSARIRFVSCGPLIRLRDKSVTVGQDRDLPSSPTVEIVREPGFGKAEVFRSRDQRHLAALFVAWHDYLTSMGRRVARFFALTGE
jgi:hypothetical protein